MDGISPIMGSIQYNQGIKYKGSTLTRKNHQNFMDQCGYSQGFLLESEVSSEVKAFLMVAIDRLYSGKKKSKSERNTRRYMLYTVWRPGGINKSCVL